MPDYSAWTRASLASRIKESLPRGEMFRDEGVHRGASVYDHDPLTGRRAKWSLTGMVCDHVFYSAALLQMTGVTIDSVALFWAEQNLPRNETPYEITFDRTVLQGLPSPFDRTIYACPANHATHLLKFLDRFAAGQGSTAHWESLHQRLQIVDWPMVHSLAIMPDEPPTVPISLYGVVGASVIYHWRPPTAPWKSPIWLAQSPKNPPPRVRKPTRGRSII